MQPKCQFIIPKTLFNSNYMRATYPTNSDLEVIQLLKYIMHVVDNTFRIFVFCFFYYFFLLNHFQGIKAFVKY